MLSRDADAIVDSSMTTTARTYNINIRLEALDGQYTSEECPINDLDNLNGGEDIRNLFGRCPLALSRRAF